MPSRKRNYPPLAIAERWLPKPVVLENTAGMHRFVWDLRWSSSGTDEIEEDEGYGAPRGPRATPGIYQIKLTVDGKIFTQNFKVEMDPRSSATTAELDEQLRLGLEIFAEARRTRKALAEIGAAKQRLSDLKTQLAGKNPGTADAGHKSGGGDHEDREGKSSPLRPWDWRLQAQVWHRRFAWWKAATARCRHKPSNCIASPTKRRRRESPSGRSSRTPSCASSMTPCRKQVFGRERKKNQPRSDNKNNRGLTRTNTDRNSNFLFQIRRSVFIRANPWLKNAGKSSNHGLTRHKTLRLTTGLQNLCFLNRADGAAVFKLLLRREMRTTPYVEAQL